MYIYRYDSQIVHHNPCFKLFIGSFYVWTYCLLYKVSQSVVFENCKIVHQPKTIVGQLFCYVTMSNIAMCKVPGY